MANLRCRVAVVDDDESVRNALRRLLRASDLEAEAFASGEAFFESLRAGVPDCLVLDLQMPEMNGLDLQRRLGRAGVRLPTIIITGHDQPGMRARCLAAGAEAYLRKPLDDRALLGAIASAVQRHRDAQAKSDP